MAGGELVPGKMVSGLSPAGTVSPTGLARLRCSSRSHDTSVSDATQKRTKLARKREDIEHASRRCLEGQILDRIGETERAGRITRVHLRRHDRSGPAADAGNHRDVLAPVRSLVADRLA